ncbi:MAG: GCN5-related N-acetyltransferase [Acidobacteria bacterium]|nr:GCN5-related N-acetyltransferase [Acidobacteriota bacterium]
MPGFLVEVVDGMEYEVVGGNPGPELVEAIVSLYEAGGWWAETPRARAIIPATVTGSFCFLVARETDGRVVGMARAISDGVSDAYIQDVVVLKECRGRGIGRELVRRVRDYCAERQLEWIGLVAEPGTTPFYEELGFEVLDGYAAMRLAR